MQEGVREILEQMSLEGYVADRAVATALFLARTLERPLLLEGPAGVGKTEVAKVLARMLATTLIRLRCYEGLDVPRRSMSGTMPHRSCRSSWPNRPMTAGR